MKKNLTCLYSILICLLVVINSGCRKLLEIPANAPGQLVTVQVFADSTSAISGVVGIYNSAFVGGGGPLSLYMSLYPSLSSDELNVFDTGNAFRNNALLAGNASNSSGDSGFIWNGFYSSNVIYQANAAIEGLNASNNLSSALKNQLIGECEVVRALSYFYLVNLYGPVPLATTTDYKVNNKLPRATVDLVYDQMIRDLLDAGNRLGENYPTAGRARPNKYTAMALLSRAYLYKQEWNQALATANTIINSGNYSLETLDNAFLIGNRESIWQAVAIGFYTYATYEGTTFVPYAKDIIPQYYLTNSLVNAFEPGDERLSHWTGINSIDGVDYHYPNKYKNRTDAQINGNVEGEVFLRLSEQYLIRAEAKIQLGDLQGGVDDLNIIRSRAGLAGLPVSSKETMLNAVAHERQTEFFCEWGHRWLDLKRTGTVNVVLGKEKPGTWPADGHASLYPIPLNQITLNPGWKQNPGY